ncbi:hypothetical protein [Kitasatospora sp. NBC_01302]|uniref:hypothetical protein n=1 Tax=Kitasatospora sp. NBC_01302 TaxID=2903575 RepID=UPI002E13F411|nr:hypothetical protein OG294_10750 [Kitasatospora sp. NBC_01302]
MPLEDSITELLREAADLAPDTPGELLADGGERRGRRRVARRRAGIVAGGVAVLAVAGLVAVQLRPGDDRVAPSSRQTTASPGPSSALATLVPLLPPGRTSERSGPDPVTGQGPAARLVFDDGHGATLLQLSTATVGLPLGDDTDGTQCPDPFMMPTEDCTRTVRPDGAILVVDRAAPFSTDPAKEWSAVYTRVDGRQVRLDEYNSRTPAGPATRADPALSAEQLTAVVTSSSWDGLIGAARPVTAPTTGTPAPKAPRPADVLATADRLLPAGVQHDNGTTPQTTAGEGHLTVTAAGRSSVLVITVDPQLDRGAGDPRGAFEGSVRAGQQLTRAVNGGSSVITSTTPVTTSSGAPASLWMVEAMLPDGTGVTIDETDGSNGYDIQPGPPVLTIDQLTALATDPGWQQH